MLTRDRRSTSLWLQRVSRRGFLCRISGFAAAGLYGMGLGKGLHAFAVELQQLKDPTRPTPFEQLHLPILRIPSFTRNGAHVPIVVEMTHPMTPEHYVTSVQILNESDPVSSKGTFHLHPTNGQVYLAVQARMHSGASTVQAIAECNLHGRWAASQPITIPDGAGGCATVLGGAGDRPANDEIRPPVIRIPELVERGKIHRGELIRVQIKLKHPSRTGLAFQGTVFLQAADPFYLKEMEVFYGDRLVTRYEMTPAISDNPFITLKLRALEEKPIRIVLTNSRGQQFQATKEIVLS